MKTNKILLYIILVSAFITVTSCFTSNSNNDQMTDIHTSANSLDWYGVYKGVIPCADCEGIEIKITLKKDSTFSRVSKYLGKEDNLFFEEGSFEWDSTGSKIILLGEGKNQMYKIGENMLFHLDREGNQITGDLASNYIIHKNRVDYSLVDKKWILIELNGATITNSSEERIAFIRFDMETGLFSGSNSCNRFFGDYEILKGNQIKLGPAGATLMACPDAKYEQAFMEMLRKIDNYTVYEGVLSLNKAKMAPLARFKLALQDQN